MPKCKRCHRELKSESSIKNGYGSGCWREIKKVVVKELEVSVDGGKTWQKRKIDITKVKPGEADVKQGELIKLPWGKKNIVRIELDTVNQCLYAKSI